jgi:hypothetical protein
MLWRLAKTDARIYRNPAACDAQRLGCRNSRRQGIIDIQQHIAIARVILHRLRGALRMHQDHRRALSRHKRPQRGVEPQRRDVVDQIGPRPQCRLGHRRLARVDRDHRLKPRRPQR